MRLLKLVIVFRRDPSKARRGIAEHTTIARAYSSVVVVIDFVRGLNELLIDDVKHIESKGQTRNSVRTMSEIGIDPVMRVLPNRAGSLLLKFNNLPFILH